ncbi:hypothetical protein SARC_18227 [Sphaeroforma arctica JP610]|uniref:Uncharacterized protein n=1 Tax=Sphaeroforma arctica JP610 TaxID=667725 RepID=A0A0L0EXR0_9EUKA|nr:hypothetical protein SARC_18227 [Sphaeroforma arctica JP610]KNC69262.1 hypothetical protein SARC_18227 [Sphaeroforma arctica JP610]|eukprot:XP_014143164.1 hypothetical protein SARC_18227 [Sphaeroforma arctica JP610]
MSLYCWEDDKLEADDLLNNTLSQGARTTRALQATYARDPAPASDASWRSSFGDRQLQPPVSMTTQNFATQCQIDTKDVESFPDENPQWSADGRKAYRSPLHTSYDIPLD